MDTLTQVVGLGIAITGMIGFFASVMWIARWYSAPIKRD